jgi:hypothetical protein
MTDLTSFRSVVDLWRTREAMASEVGAMSSTVRKWWKRDNIPSEWWWAILATDTAKAAGLTPDLLTRLRRRVEVRA